MVRLRNMIVNMLKQAVLSVVSDDSKDFPDGQASYNEKATKFVRLSNYGLDSNPPKDSFVLILNSQAQESVKFGLLTDFVNRKKDLKEGEVALFNTKTKTFLFLKANGDIDIQSNGNVNVVGDLNITGNLTTTGNTNISGNLTVSGTISSGAITSSGTITGTDVIAGIVSGKTHVHGGVTTGQGTTGTPI